MAEFLGQIFANCQENTPLTRMGSCDKEEGKTINLLINLNVNASYPLDAEAFAGNLRKYVISSGADRIIPIGGIKQTTLSGNDFNTIDDGDYGEQKTTNVTAQTDVFSINGGDCLWKQLAKFNKKRVRVMRYDDESYLYNTAFMQGDKPYMRGFLATLYVRRVRATGTTAYTIELQVCYSANKESEEKSINAFELASIPEGLMGIMLKAGVAGTASVVTTCGGLDITADHEWDKTSFVTKTGDNPTAVSLDSDTGLLTIAPAGSYRIATADILDMADIIGYEGVDEYVNIS